MDIKVIIAGSRFVTDFEKVLGAVIHSGFNIDEVVSGGASGADKLGEDWAAVNLVPVKRFPADWLYYGKAAGPRRNRQMANYADALIAIWDGKSRGTFNMIETMKRRGKPFWIEHI
jgi:hypothetical protein